MDAATAGLLGVIAGGVFGLLVHHRPASGLPVVVEVMLSL